MSAPDENAALLFPANAQDGVLVVFKSDHRVILLEPFKMPAKPFLGDRQFSWLMRHHADADMQICGSAACAIRGHAVSKRWTSRIGWSRREVRQRLSLA
jgi:hypothetical protein